MKEFLELVKLKGVTKLAILGEMVSWFMKKMNDMESKNMHEKIQENNDLDGIIYKK